MAWGLAGARVRAGRLVLGMVCGIAALGCVQARAAALSGRVLEVYGGPLAGIPPSVRTAPTTPLGDRLPSTDAAHEAASGADGSYTIHGLEDAAYEIGIASARLGVGRAYEIVRARINGVSVVVGDDPLLLGIDGAGTDLDITVVRVASFPIGQRVGFNVTRADGSAAAGATMRYQILRGDGGSSATGRTTDDEGQIEFSQSSPNVGTLTLSHKGQSALLRLRFEENAPNRGPVDITLSPGGTWHPYGSEWRRNPANNHEYRVITAASWQAAEEAAHAQGAHLATIGGEAEARWVAGLLDRNVSAYIGLSRDGEAEPWRWVTGEPVGYARWRDGEPNNMNGVEHYASMRGGEGEWNDEDGDAVATFGHAIMERERRDALPPLEVEIAVPDARELMPLAVGAVWTYEDQVSGETGTISVEGATEDSTGTVSYTVAMSVFEATPRMSYDRGGLLVEVPGEDDVPLVPWLPAEGEQAWDVWVGDRDSVMRFQIVDVQGTVDTPSGPYEGCTVVRLVVPGEDLGYFHYAPGVGCVRLTFAESRREGARLWGDGLLASYTVGE